jgi:hypothetical protein
MEAKSSPQHLRELLSLAKKLRDSATQTDERQYRDLFDNAATALEERAHRLAYEPIEWPELKVDSYSPVNLIC